MGASQPPEGGVQKHTNWGTEKECLKLVFATPRQASERWPRISFSEYERRQIERYRQGDAGGGKGPWFWVLRTELRRGDWP